MDRFFKAIAVVFLVSICGTAFRSMGLVEDEDYLPDNAPDGVYEYFENQDGTSSIALFEDKLVAKGDFIGTNEIVIMVSDISRVKRSGTQIKVVSNDGSEVTFSLDFFARNAAVRFTDTLNDLIKDSKGSGSSPY